MDAESFKTLGVFTGLLASGGAFTELIRWLSTRSKAKLELEQKDNGRLWSEVGRLQGHIERLEAELGRLRDERHNIRGELQKEQLVRALREIEINKLCDDLGIPQRYPDVGKEEKPVATT